MVSESRQRPFFKLLPQRKPMNMSPDDLKEAMDIMGIHEQASLMEIRKRYKDLIFEWHPDRCKQNPEICKEKMHTIQDAYTLILSYCEQVKISFKDEDIRRFTGKGEAFDFWYDRFGDDPIWG
jgi:DnaJ-class molecular chaperone